MHWNPLEISLVFLAVSGEIKMITEDVMNQSNLKVEQIVKIVGLPFMPIDDPLGAEAISI